MVLRPRARRKRAVLLPTGPLLLPVERALDGLLPALVSALALVLALALQTDVLGVHWLAYVVWTAAGLAPTAARGRAGPV